MEEAETEQQAMELLLLGTRLEEGRVVDGVAVIRLEEVGAEASRRFVGHLDALRGEGQRSEIKG